MKLSMNEIDNLLWLFQKNVPEDKLGHKVKVQLLKVALLQEVNMPALQIEASKDPFSSRWHSIFDDNVGKLKSIFSSLGASSEQIDNILREYAKISNQSIWRRA
ncbi:MAG: hypothetical protein SFU27_05035 [Thermonemataceae bacterium]|nr:hypothetical protein [Thermonemataceae bacterium]